MKPSKQIQDKIHTMRIITSQIQKYLEKNKILIQFYDIFGDETSCQEVKKQTEIVLSNYV